MQKKPLIFPEPMLDYRKHMAKKEKTMSYGSTRQNVRNNAIFALMPYAVFAHIITIAIITIIIR